MIQARSAISEVALCVVFYAEGVTQLSPGQVIRASSENHAALGCSSNNSPAEESGYQLSPACRGRINARHVAVSATRRFMENLNLDRPQLRRGACPYSYLLARRSQHGRTARLFPSHEQFDRAERDLRRTKFWFAAYAPEPKYLVNL